ncbi:MAG: RtcB family protein [Proteobacteria bacterium]|nr:RtcB family protein [Pseudomonadota bacterium]
MSENYIVDSNNKFPIKAWTKGVQVEDVAADQLRNMANLPFIHKHIAVMPDVHWGMGATIGSVIPTKGAIIPAAVGVDIGCGMMAVQTDFPASRLPDNLKELRGAIERAVPHGRTHHGGANDRGAWHDVPDRIGRAWSSTELEARYDIITEKHPKALSRNNVRHLGTLGTGNHFIEVCLDEDDLVWVMLHSGSRGCGNRIGTYFIQRAKKEMERGFIQLPDMNLAYLTEGSELFRDYVEAVGWAQDFAAENRVQMMKTIVLAMENVLGPLDIAADEAVDCHHNYVIQENHFGSNVWITRKGAVRAREGDLGIIPGSMGVRSYIVRGKGNPESFHSCAHGAGRAMSRREAKMKFSIEDHVKATEGVECRKDEGVIDETPMAYKDIDAVMRAQEDLVEIVHTLKQVICVKG